MSGGTVRVWEKMDATIDSDPRIAACHPHEATALAIYLFILRRGRLDCHPGKVKPRSLEIHYLARMLFMPEESLRLGLVELLRNHLIQVWRDGAEVDVTLRHVTLSVAQDTKNSVTRPVTEIVTEAIADSDFVQVVGWENYDSAPNKTTDALGPKSSNQVRQERYRKRQKTLAKIGARAVRDAERQQTRMLTRQHTTSTNASPDATSPGSGPASPTAYVNASVNGREIDRENRERDQISLVPGDPGTGEIELSESDSSTGRQKGRVKADRIPEYCYRAADYLREMVLDRNPEADIGRRPWDNQRRPPNVHHKPPPDELRRVGNRLKWADVIRLIVENDGRTKERLIEVIKWLWKGQPARLGTGFIVESPTTLREKWGAITMHMNGRGSAPQTDPGGVDRAVAKLEEAMARQANAPVPDGGDA